MTIASHIISIYLLFLQCNVQILQWSSLLSLQNKRTSRLAQYRFVSISNNDACTGTHCSFSVLSHAYSNPLVYDITPLTNESFFEQ